MSVYALLPLLLFSPWNLGGWRGEQENTVFWSYTDNESDHFGMHKSIHLVPINLVNVFIYLTQLIIPRVKDVLPKCTRWWRAGRGCVRSSAMLPVSCLLIFLPWSISARHRAEEESLGFEDEGGGQTRAKGWEDDCDEWVSCTFPPFSKYFNFWFLERIQPVLTSFSSS